MSSNKKSMEWLVVGDTKKVEKAHEDISQLVKSSRSVEFLLKKIANGSSPFASKLPSQSTNIPPSRKVAVSVSSQIEEIGEIDVARQEFYVDIQFSLTWKDPTLKNKNDQDVDWADHWDPRPVIPNAVTAISLVEERYIASSLEGQAGMTIRFKGTLRSRMCFKYFPFDKQNLVVKLSSELQSEEVEFIRNQSIKNTMNTQNFYGSRDWTLYPHVITNIPTGKRPTPLLEITTHVQRNHTPFVLNGMLVVFLILVLSFSSFVVDSHLPAERLTTKILLLIGIMLVKRTLVTKIPDVSIMTLLDKYILCNIVLMWLFIVEIPIEALIDEHGGERKHLFSIVCICFLLSSFVILNLVFIVLCLYKVLDTSAKLRSFAKGATVAQKHPSGNDKDSLLMQSDSKV